MKTIFSFPKYEVYLHLKWRRAGSTSCVVRRVHAWRIAQDVADATIHSCLCISQQTAELFLLCPDDGRRQRKGKAYIIFLDNSSARTEKKEFNKVSSREFASFSINFPLIKSIFLLSVCRKSFSQEKNIEMLSGKYIRRKLHVESEQKISHFIDSHSFRYPCQSFRVEESKLKAKRKFTRK